MMKKSVLLMLAAATLSGCANSELTERTPVNPGELDIVISSSHTGIEVSTRKPYMDEISEANPLETRVLTSETKGDYGTRYADGKITFRRPGRMAGYDPKSMVTGASTTKFPENGNPDAKFYFRGFHPYDNWSVDTDGKKAEFIITGKADVMAAKEVSATPDEIADGKVPALAFKHLLTKLEISLASHTELAPDVWGVIKKIELSSVAGEGNIPQNTVSVNLETERVQYSGSNSPTIYNITDGEYTDTPYTAQRLPEESTLIGYSMIAPFSAGAPDDLIFFVTTEYNNDPVPVKVQLPYDGDTTGRAFHITFTFKATDDVIRASATVEPWKDSGDTNVEIE